MKKYSSFVLAVLLLLTLLSGCSSYPDTVPDSLVQTVVSGETCGNSVYSYDPECISILHDPDTDAHTDTVDVEMAFSGVYCDLVYESTYTFQYSRDSDIWSCISREEPCYLRKDFYESAINGEYFSGEKSKYGYGRYNWEVNVIDFDYEEGTFTVEYNITNTYNNGEDSLNWSDTETFYFCCDYYDDIYFEIPCGYTQGSKSYDLFLRIRFSSGGISDYIVGW